VLTVILTCFSYSLEPAIQQIASANLNLGSDGSILTNYTTELSQHPLHHYYISS